MELGADIYIDTFDYKFLNAQKKKSSELRVCTLNLHPEFEIKAAFELDLKRDWIVLFNFPKLDSGLLALVVFWIGCEYICFL